MIWPTKIYVDFKGINKRYNSVEHFLREHEILWVPRTENIKVVVGVDSISDNLLLTHQIIIMNFLKWDP